MGNLSHTVGGTDNLVSFKSAARVPIDSLKVYFSPIQEGEGDPSPENVRPIRGWNGVEVYRASASNLTIPVTFPVTGKNKFNGEISNADIFSNGQIGNFTAKRISASLISVAHGQYTLSCSENYPVAIYAYDDNGFIANESVVTWQESPATFMIENAKYVRFKWKKPDDSAFSPSDITNIQLELGSEATTYETYNPDNTIYGGYVDLAKGEVVAEWAKVKKKLSECSVKNERNEYVCYDFHSLSDIPCYADATSTPHTIRKEHSMCSLGYHSWSAFDNLKPHYYIFKNTDNNATRALLFLPIEDIESDDIEFELAFRLEAPIHYPLTPIQLKTFLNNNAFWSNTNDVTEGSYAIHDTTPIRAAKKRIMAASPKLETASSDLVTFNTDVTAPLKECKVYFEPVQEGEGDPSPENIRPIVGWNNIEVTKCGKNLFDISVMKSRPNITVEDDTFIGAPFNMYNNKKTELLHIPKNTSITVSCIAYNDGQYGTGGSGFSPWFYYKNGNNICPWYTSNYLLNPTTYSGSIVFESDVVNYLFGYYNYSNNIWHVSNMQFEIGSSMTEYEPYKGITIPITFPTEAGTVYGGYVDLVNGEIIKNWNFYTITGEETFYESGDWVSIFVPSGMQASDDASLRMAGFCSHYPYRAYSRGKIGVMYNERTVTLDGNIYDAAGWKAYCQEQYNNGTPITLCYPLKTPIHYPINPQTLKTLHGVNNIWSTSNGPISIKYWKH